MPRARAFDLIARGDKIRQPAMSAWRIRHANAGPRPNLIRRTAPIEANRDPGLRCTFRSDRIFWSVRVEAYLRSLATADDPNVYKRPHSSSFN
jgi:hypothetical protein